MLNLMRVLGTSLGVASASSMLSWRMQVASGSHERRLSHFSQPHLIEAAQSGLVMLAVFAAIAGALSLTRRTPADRDMFGGGAPWRLGRRHGATQSARAAGALHSGAVFCDRAAAVRLGPYDWGLSEPVNRISATE